ncbi:MAG TPA: Ig-like domain repeat protein, partial [Candidatus Acidoferrum sp.]|nr:Ig-like domain repeat protein [Candidatus Acidoferrum sp.]
MFKVIPSVIVTAILCLSCAVFTEAQQQPTNAVPFVSGITPPSLALTSNGGFGSATLTITGANFPQNAVVKLSFETNAIQPTSTTVNAAGSQITAQFSGNVPQSPLTFNVTVTNPNGPVPTVSNVVYLPQLVTTSTVLLNRDRSVSGPSIPSAVAVADLQANGLPSLAIASQAMDTVTTELNNFNGFQTGSSVSVGVQPYAIATGEFLRGDILPEFAVTNSQDRTVTLLVANGTNGSYRQFSSIPVPGYYPTGIVAGDFNRDGIMDLAVVSTCTTNFCYPTAIPELPGSVTIFLGDGIGGFSASPVQLVTDNSPFAIATADLNGDGILDLVVVNSGSNTLSVFMGNGDGTFTQTSASPATGANPKAIVIGDFNRDGFPDVAVANYADNTISILLNQNCASVAATACSFTPAAAPPAVGYGIRAITTGDMNGDGFLDLVVAGGSGGSVNVLLGDGTGAFTVVPPFYTGPDPMGVVVADFNQDGRLDIVTVDSIGSSYTLMQQAVVAQLQLTTNLATLPYGYVPTLSVQIQPGPAPAGPTGTISLYDGSTTITSATLSGFQYQLQFLLPPAYFFGAGIHQLTAVYSGDSNFAPVASNVVTETVTQTPTTTTLASNVTNAPYGMAITLSATIQPQAPAPATGTVTFFDTTNSTTIGTAAITNNSAQFVVSNLSGGSHSIVATYQGDANCTWSSSSPVALTVSTASTTTTMGAAANPAGYGQNVTLTATVQPPSGTPASGTVNFLDGGTLLGTATIANNTAQLSVSSLSVGTHTLTAAYSGDGNLSGSTSTPVAETINKASTSTTVTASPNPAVFNLPVSFVIAIAPAAGGTPSGTVTLLDGTSTLATATLVNGGPAHITFSGLAPGTHSITAVYSGDASFAGSTSAAVAETINQASSTTAVSSGLNPSTFGQAVTLTANVQAPQGITPSGTVTFLDGTTALGTANLASGSAQLAVAGLTAGAHNITATYSGSTYLTGSTSSTLAQNVSTAASATVLTSSANPATYNQNVVLTATIQPPFGGNAT